MKAIGLSLRRVGPIRGVGTTICIAGVVAIAVGVRTAGLWLCAIGVGVVVIAWAGLTLTDYQRSVALAIRPLSRTALTSRLPFDERNDMIASIEALLAPSSLDGLHRNVIRSMLQSATQSDADRAATVENAIAARQVLKEVQNLTTERVPSQDRAYITQLRNIVNSYIRWYDARSALYHEGTSEALTRLRAITPPSRKQMIHHDLIEAVASRDELMRDRRECIEAGDVDGALETNERVSEAERRIRTCLDSIKGWA